MIEVDIFHLKNLVFKRHKDEVLRASIVFQLINSEKAIFLAAEPKHRKYTLKLYMKERFKQRTTISIDVHKANRCAISFICRIN